MKRARRFTVNEQTFGLSVDFYVDAPQALALKRCVALLDLDPADPENAPDDSAAAWAMCHGPQAVVWVEDGEDPSSLVHELYHVTQAFLKHIESYDEETGAYLLAYLYKEARKKLNRK